MRKISNYYDHDPFTNWLYLYSYMLFPEDEKKQRAIFSYFYCKYIASLDIDYFYIFPKEELKNAIDGLSYLVDQGDIQKLIKKKEKAILATGTLLRIIYTASKFNEQISLSRAVFLFLRLYAKEHQLTGSKPFNLSRSKVIEYYKNRYDVLHFCAAYTLLRPPLRIKHHLLMKSRLWPFIGLSNLYLDFGTKFMIGDPDGRALRYLINPETCFFTPTPTDHHMFLYTFPLHYPKDILSELVNYREDKRGDKYD